MNDDEIDRSYARQYKRRLRRNSIRRYFGLPIKWPRHELYLDQYGSFYYRSDGTRMYVS